MPPTKTDTGHGALFDRFPDRPTSLHGGAKFDEGFNLQDKSAPKGPNFDQFGQPTEPDQGGRGPVWDEFGWKEMPDFHGGTLYDEGFDSPSANGTSRGPLFDLFEPGSQVKFIYDGQDSEGIVQTVRGDAVMVQPRKGGDAVEVGLEQFLAYRSPSMDNASTGLEASEAEAPSAWSSDARGGLHNKIPLPANAGVPGAPPTPGTPVEATPQGSSVPANARDEVAVDWSPLDHLKTVLSGDDIAKAANEFETKLHNSGYRMSRGPSLGAVDHWSNRSGHRIGASVEHTPGKVAAGYHYENGDHRTLDGPFHSHSEAHNAIVAHHEGLDEMSGRIRNHAVDHGQASTKDVSKSLLSGLDVLKTRREVPVENVMGRIGNSQARLPSDRLGKYSVFQGIDLGKTGNNAPENLLRLVQLEALGKARAAGLTVVKDGDVFLTVDPETMIVKEMTDDSQIPRLIESGVLVAKTVGDETELRIVAKEVTVAETAIQAEDNAATLAGGKGKHFCPECRANKSSLSDDGRCPDCNMVLEAHEPGKKLAREKGDGNGDGESSAGKGVGKLATVADLRKAFGASGDSLAGGQTLTSDGDPGSRGQQKGSATGDPPDVEVPVRPHPDSDHHEDEKGSMPGTCPHCGKVLAELDVKSEEGAPTHKCVEMLAAGDVMKAAA